MAFFKNKKGTRITLISIALVLAVIVGVCWIYVADYYRADAEAIAAFGSQVACRTLQDGSVVYEPENATKGFIFYPGGKVEHTAYQPLMAALAEQGILCVSVEMPFRLAVLDMDAAENISEQFPQITQWYIGGHSLGGSMAASHLANETDDYKGLVLLGAYSTADMSQSGLQVLSIYGSEDQVMNRDKYQNNKGNLPADFTELVIAGGCHAGFGMYGPQAGDGTPIISSEEQIIQSAQAIAEWMQ